MTSCGCGKMHCNICNLEVTVRSTVAVPEGLDPKNYGVRSLFAGLPKVKSRQIRFPSETPAVGRIVHFKVERDYLKRGSFDPCCRPATVYDWTGEEDDKAHYRGELVLVVNDVNADEDGRVPWSFITIAAWGQGVMQWHWPWECGKSTEELEKL